MVSGTIPYTLGQGNCYFYIFTNPNIGPNHIFLPASDDSDFLGFHLGLNDSVMKNVFPNLANSGPFIFMLIELGRTCYFDRLVSNRHTQSFTNACCDPFLAEITEFLIFCQPDQNYFISVIQFQYWPHNFPLFSAKCWMFKTEYLLIPTYHAQKATIFLLS